MVRSPKLTPDPDSVTPKSTEAKNHGQEMREKRFQAMHLMVENVTKKISRSILMMRDDDLMTNSYLGILAGQACAVPFHTVTALKVDRTDVWRTDVR